MSCTPHRWERLAKQIKQFGRTLGFQQVGITDTDLTASEPRLLQWLEDGRHGDMDWMARYADKRTQPDKLIENTIRIISARLDYLPTDCRDMESILSQHDKAYISRYALGRDYHKLMRRRLQKLAQYVEKRVGTFGYRVFADSAPVMEKPLAEKAGLGWIGKHTNLLNKQSGSWFFLGEIYVDLPLPIDRPAQKHCGDCQTCMDICPTRAITAPYQLDPRLCISYLTIEHKGAIPLALRPLIGNRVYGCDDCQIFCPWNRFADHTGETDFHPRHRLDDITLLELFAWDEKTFLKKTEGSAIRRIGHERWLRNIAVGLGNCQNNKEEIIPILEARRQDTSELVKEHINWALENLRRLV